MIKVILFFAVFTIICQLFTLSVSAHVLESSGSVGAVMHVSPDDDPVAGEQSDFYFEFKDKNGKFKPQDCSCIITISDSSGKELFNQALFSGNRDTSLTNASFSFTFPQRDVYLIKISGKPTAGQFNEFNLVYDLRVERTSDNSNSSSPTGQKPNWVMTHLPHLIGGFLVLGFLIFALAKERLKKKGGA